MRWLFAGAGRISGAQPSKGFQWKDDVVSCSGSESILGYEVYEHNNECRALEVIGQDWSSEVVAFFLEGWELALVGLSYHMAWDLLCQEVKDACQESSLSRCSQCSQPSLCSQCLEDSLTVEGP